MKGILWRDLWVSESCPCISNFASKKKKVCRWVLLVLRGKSGLSLEFRYLLFYRSLSLCQSSIRGYGLAIHLGASMLNPYWVFCILFWIHHLSALWVLIITWVIMWLISRDVSSRVWREHYGSGSERKTRTDGDRSNSSQLRWSSACFLLRTNVGNWQFVWDWVLGHKVSIEYVQESLHQETYHRRRLNQCNIMGSREEITSMKAFDFV